jgi:transcriptional regulator with XRE-family HTH domain
MSDWGAEIERMRKEQGLSRRALATLAETQPTTLRRFERGGARLSIVMLERFASALGYELDLIKACDDA